MNDFLLSPDEVQEGQRGHVQRAVLSAAGDAAHSVCEGHGGDAQRGEDEPIAPIDPDMQQRMMSASFGTVYLHKYNFNKNNCVYFLIETYLLRCPFVPCVFVGEASSGMPRLTGRR